MRLGLDRGHIDQLRDIVYQVYTATARANLCTIYAFETPGAPTKQYL